MNSKFFLKNNRNRSRNYITLGTNVTYVGHIILTQILDSSDHQMKLILVNQTTKFIVFFNIN